MLTFNNVSKSFGSQQVLSNVTLQIPQGANHALIGSSGSGKTTLLRATMGLTLIDSGSITLMGEEFQPSRHEQWVHKIGYVPQEGGLFPHLTAEENITLVARIKKWKKTKIKTRLEELCAVVSLPQDLLKQYPRQLSGGQRQRVALIRAAFLNPALMILDEPLGALDPLLRFEVQSELQEIFQKLNKTVLIVTHDIAEAVFFANSLTLLHAGRVVQTGRLADLVHSPADPFVTQFINAHRSWESALREEDR